MKKPWYRSFSFDRKSQAVKTDALANAETNNSLGVLYASRGVAGFSNAAACFQKAAEHGHAMAQNNLALMYAMGLGFDKNWTEAAKWFRRGADQGDAGAQYHLGVHYHRASMVKDPQIANESRIEAYKWFQLAATQGYWKADSCLERVNLQMDQRGVTEARRRVANFVAKNEQSNDPAGN